MDAPSFTSKDVGSRSTERAPSTSWSDVRKSPLASRWSPLEAEETPETTIRNDREHPARESMSPCGMGGEHKISALAMGS